jgi:DNA adenine methylase
MAARFLYLNQHCFNGIYRTNKNGNFNVPYSLPKTKRRIDTDRFFVAAALLNRVTLLAGDFESTLRRVERGDFVYLDPPYAVDDRRIFAEYHPDTFQTTDLKRLKLCLESINEKGASFVISYADSREARAALAPWRPKRVRTRRHIAGFADNRRTAFELIASNLPES